MGLLTAAAVIAAIAAGPAEPQVVETRTVDLTQTVTLDAPPAGSDMVRLWVPIPSDASWQRVLQREVLSAPTGWRLVPQAEGRGDFVYAEVRDPIGQPISVVVRCTVEREAAYTPLDGGAMPQSIQPALFADSLDERAPLMEVDERVRALADKACGAERDPARQALLLLNAVANAADHYSKDPTKPTCGRGAASDCIDQGGGCCTDLHSLFISAARSRGIPARMQYGYRMLDAKAGQELDPGYRCWVEYLVPGAGWVPTDVVAADNAGEAHANRWGSLSASRVCCGKGAASFHGRGRGRGRGPGHGRAARVPSGWSSSTCPDLLRIQLIAR
jgi:transglutaminase-like putative cysteine protease